MPVYVDDMNAKYGRMIMCHMLADSDEELHEMAQKIGVQRRWHQHPDTPKSHYDICLAKKKLAVEFGAIEISWRDAAGIVRKRKVESDRGQN